MHSTRDHQTDKSNHVNNVCAVCLPMVGGLLGGHVVVPLPARLLQRMFCLPIYDRPHLL